MLKWYEQVNLVIDTIPKVGKKGANFHDIRCDGGDAAYKTVSPLFMVHSVSYKFGLYMKLVPTIEEEDQCREYMEKITELEKLCLEKLEPAYNSNPRMKMAFKNNLTNVETDVNPVSLCPIEVLVCKSNKTPTFVDFKNNNLPANCVRHGDLVRVMQTYKFFQVDGQRNRVSLRSDTPIVQLVCQAEKKSGCENIYTKDLGNAMPVDEIYGRDFDPIPDMDMEHSHN